VTHPVEPGPELTTARVRGGPSPWLVAVVALAVLGSVVYIGVSGHDSTPTHTANPATSQPVAQLPAPTPVRANLAPPWIVTPGFPGAAVLGSNPSAARPHQYLGAELEIAGIATLAVLTTPEPGRLHAAYKVPLPVPVDAANLRLVDVTDEQPQLATYGTWSIPLDVFHGGVNQDSVIGAFGPTVLVQSIRPPDPAADPSAPAIARNGYGIQVTAERQDDTELLYLDLSLGSGPDYPDETYKVTATAGSGHFAADHEQSLPGHIRGEILIANSVRAAKVALKITAVSISKARPQTAVVATDKLAMPKAANYPTGDPTIEIVVAAQHSHAEFPGILMAGYQLRLLFTYDGYQRALFYDLQINPTFPGAPSATAQ
jgi:hypothetical protein